MLNSSPLFRLAFFVAATTLATTALAAQNGKSATPANHGDGGPKAHWSYSGAEGPANWGGLAPMKIGYGVTPLHVVINGRDLLPANHDYYRFVGSLTTPPCSEGVQWHVLKTPIKASATQIQAFVAIVGKNNRPVQPLGHRLFIASAAGGKSSH